MSRTDVAPQRAAQFRERRISIYVLVDALGWTYLQDRDFLSDLLPYRKPLRTVLGFSSGAIPSILTGLPPARNGRWNLYYYDPSGSPFRRFRWLRFLPEPIVQHRVTVKLFQQIGRRLLGLGPLFDCAVSPRLLPWFNWAEKENIYTPGGIPGAKSIFDRLVEDAVPHRVYTYHDWTDEQILARAESDLESTDCRFFFLYLSELDGFLHMHCLDTAQVNSRIDSYERGLRTVFSIARKLDRNAELTVFSDHGMTPITGEDPLPARVNALGLSTPEDYLAVYDSTMARYWFFNAAARDSIHRVLNSSPAGRILTDAELERLGVFFPDRRYGDTVYLLSPGWVIAGNGFSGKRWMPAGMHGYHPDDSFSDAIYLSSIPPSVEVQSITDVFGCMLRSALTQQTHSDSARGYL